MLALALIAAATMPADSEAALTLCRPALARKAGGDIATITVTSGRKAKSGFAVEGQMTVFVGMSPPQRGFASTHHLIGTDFIFHCRTAGKRVREASVTPRR